MRRGISLLEVLFAMFVLSMGLLSLAMLIPIGKFRIIQADNDARGSEMGNAGKAHIENCGYLHPSLWSNYAGANITGPPTGTFVVDPYGLAENAGVAGATVFPYSAPAAHQVDRITLWPSSDPRWANLSGAGRDMLAGRTFVGELDLTIVQATGDEDRPSLDITGQIVPSAGDYSWAFMATPKIQLDTTGTSFIDRYVVHILSFYKRNALLPATGDVDPAGERTLYADMVGGGVFGGGDVTLHSDGAGEAFLKVKVGHWLLLSGELLAANTTATPSPKIQWYRVVTAGPPYDLNADDVMDAVDVTLQGTDFTLTDSTGAPLYVDADADSSNGTTLQATLFAGLIHVLETTMAAP